MQHFNNQIWSRHGPGASSECLHIHSLMSHHIFIILLHLSEKLQPVYVNFRSFSAGIQRSRIQKKTRFHLWARLQIQTVSQIFKISSFFFMKHWVSFRYSLINDLFVTEGTCCLSWSTQRRKCPHGEHELHSPGCFKCRCVGMIKVQ